MLTMIIEPTGYAERVVSLCKSTSIEKSNIKATLYKLTDETDIKDEIEVESVEVLQWNLIVDIVEHPYPDKDLFWGNTVVNETFL